jgi:hypothetical protein
VSRLRCRQEGAVRLCVGGGGGRRAAFARGWAGQGAAGAGGAGGGGARAGWGCLARRQRGAGVDQPLGRRGASGAAPPLAPCSPPQRGPGLGAFGPMVCAGAPAAACAADPTAPSHSFPRPRPGPAHQDALEGGKVLQVVKVSHRRVPRQRLAPPARAGAGGRGREGARTVGKGRAVGRERGGSQQPCRAHAPPHRTGRSCRR